MAIIDKSKAELIAELQQLEQESSNLKAVLNKEIRELNSTIDLLQGKMINCEAVFESSPVAMFIIDETTNIVMVNLAAVKLCGGSEEEILQHRPGNALRCAHSSKDPRGCGYSPDCKLCNVRNGIESLIADGGNIAGAELEFNLIKNGKPQIVWMIVGVEPMIYSGSKHWCIAMNDITEKQLAKEKLKSSEHDLAEAERIGKTGSWNYEVSTDTASWSANMFRIFDVNPEMPTELVFKYFVGNLVHPDDREHVLSVFADALSGKRPYDLEYRTIKNDGTFIYIHAIAETKRDENGKAIRMIGKVEDITERKHNQDLLRTKNQKIEDQNNNLLKINEELKQSKEKSEESEKRYRILLNNLSTGVVVHDADTSIVLSNSRAAELLGISEDQMIGKVAMDPQWKFIFEDYTTLPLNEYPVMRIINSKNPIKNQVLGVCRSSENIVWLMVNGFPFLDNSGRIVEIVISFVDITELKRTEDALRKNEERFNHAMKASTDGLFDWNLETNEIYYAPAWKKMLGYEDHELPNDFSVWEITTDPEDVRKSWELQKLLISKQIDRFVLEFKMKHKDGHWVDILSRAGAIFNDTGKAIRIVGNHTDITDRKLAEKEIQKQLDELRRWYEVTIDREGKVLELKKEVNELLKQSGKPVKYKSTFADDADVEVKN